MACASWPHLKELIIYDNPLTRTSKGKNFTYTHEKIHDLVDLGMPPLVQECLVDDKGVNVIL